MIQETFGKRNPTPFWFVVREVAEKIILFLDWLSDQSEELADTIQAETEIKSTAFLIFNDEDEEN